MKYLLPLIILLPVFSFADKLDLTSSPIYVNPLLVEYCGDIHLYNWSIDLENSYLEEELQEIYERYSVTQKEYEKLSIERSIWKYWNIQNTNKKVNKSA
jgi:hypothetical protein